MGGGEAAAEATQDLLVQNVLGKNPWETASVWQDMYNATLIQGRAGLVMNGLSAIDIALWDRNAKKAGVPLHQFLGGNSEPIQAYASGGYYAEGKGLEGLAEEVQSWMDLGFKAVKIKTGKLSIAEEEAHLKTVRSIIGEDVLLMLDLYNAMTNLGIACQYLEMAKKYNPYWIEDPFTPDDIDNFIELSKRTDIPLATGEFHYSPYIFKHIVESGAAQILQTEAQRCGGITEWRKIAQMAASRGITVNPCWFHQLHAHLVPSIPNRHFVEYFPDTFVLNFDNLISGDKVQLKDGYLHLSQELGIGFEFNEEMIASLHHTSFTVSV